MVRDEFVGPAMCEMLAKQLPVAELEEKKSRASLQERDSLEHRDILKARDSLEDCDILKSRDSLEDRGLLESRDASGDEGANPFRAVERLMSVPAPLHRRILQVVTESHTHTSPQRGREGEGFTRRGGGRERVSRGFYMHT